ncbi:suppressor of mkk1 mkk2 2 [Hibiscus trionum]|uniref:Suppressor of mkk1 mkk2 2 n=1 Tax=Hibiscus trionum TaxID=183268 RepID=A0A9W7IGL1_HIBTR|nr:suppressor of mkk1 mkk2 2 [Hibiscus trionum]
MGNIFSFELIRCDSIGSRCWDCVAGQAIYTYRLEERLSELKTALDELKEKRDDVMRKVNIAEQKSLKPLNEVQGWLSRTATMINEADQRILDGNEEIKKLCMRGCCSMDYWSTLKFSKTVVQTLHEVKLLKRKGAFEVVATEVPVAPVVERPSDSTIGMESTLNKVWSILEENHVRIVGIYGVGGVGKTRLLTEINNKIGVSSNRYDLVIWVTVSKGFLIEKVQEGIAKRVGLFSGMWEEKTAEEKALDIFRVLREKKFVLLMDDLWERVDLLKVGIPLPTSENGSKIIFTTRSIDVCGQMRSHKKIEVKCLAIDMAWDLFEEHVGNDILDGHPNIRELAHEVAKECGGLPLALITIVRAMACKRTLEEWEYAILVLKRSANFVFPNMGEEVYPLLKFSFDCLPNDKVRCCLLYCCLFTEDYQIPKEILLDCWIGEGFMDEHENISQARKQGHQIIGSLIHSCLLEEVSDSTVKMHDVIRDMCLWIACRLDAHKWKFLVQAGYQLTRVPEVGKWSGIRRMSLMQNKIEILNESPNCPELQTLLLNQNQLKVIRNEFFQSMSGLKVLCFRANRGIRELPVGISKLVSLEYLDISYTGIRQLPNELKALKKMKCLKLEYLLDGITIQRGLVSGFLKLQMLKMIGSFLFDKSSVEDNDECLVE